MSLVSAVDIYNHDALEKTKLRTRMMGLENVRITYLRSEVCRSNKLAEVSNTETESHSERSFYICHGFVSAGDALGRHPRRRRRPIARWV